MNTTLPIPASIAVPRSIRIFTDRHILPKEGPLSWARPGNVMEITVGDRYLKTLMLAHAGRIYELGELGEHTLDAIADDLDDTAWKSEVPTQDELDELLADAKEEIVDLMALGITVDFQMKNGRWSTRAPRIGDIVSVPRDIWVDRESKEPEEERELYTTTRNGRIVHRHTPEKRMPFGCDTSTDKVGGYVTLADMLDDRNAKRLAVMADTKGEGKITCALRILASMGPLSGDRFVTNECAPGLPSTEGLKNATLNLADRMRRVSGKKPKDGYWYLWTTGVRVWLEIPVHEYWDNDNRMSNWCEVDSE